MGLPRTTRQKDTIWVVVDKLTKSAHFILISEKDSLERLGKIYMEEIVRLHGVPTSIVSDRDPRFTSKFWGKMQELYGTTLKFSTTAHPQTDGQLERVIQILEDMLCACVLDFGNKWINNLAYAEFTCNNSFQSAIEMARFEALYGRKCQSSLYCGRLGRDQSIHGEMDMEETREKVQLIKKRMLASQNCQKSYVDNQRRDLEFAVGDRVFFKLTPRRNLWKSKRRRKL
jgi:hypothetical protein